MVTMQTYQMAIMLVFEDHDTFKYNDIQELLQLNVDQFQKHINSLIECKLLLVNGDVSNFIFKQLVNFFTMLFINFCF